MTDDNEAQTTVPFVSAIILAAGASRRMGVTKQLLPLGKTTILESTIDNLLGSDVNEVIVVLGHQDRELSRLIAGRPVTIALNPAYLRGMSTSIAAGLERVDPAARGVMLMLADQPFVDAATINHLLAAFARYPESIIIPLHRQKRGNPVIFPVSYQAELRALEGDIGGREIIKRHPEDVMEIAVSNEGVLIDIDTPDSYHDTGIR